MNNQKQVGSDVQLVKVEEAARRLSMSRAAVYNLMDGGKLAWVKIGRSRRIPMDSIAELVSRNTVVASA